MPADLFDYWQAYAGIKPFGHENRLLAHIAVRLLNATKGENDPYLDIPDLLPLARSHEEVVQAAVEKGMVKAIQRTKRK
jgi:hypothetical protein